MSLNFCRVLSDFLEDALSSAGIDYYGLDTDSHACVYLNEQVGYITNHCHPWGEFYSTLNTNIYSTHDSWIQMYGQGWNPLSSSESYLPLAKQTLTVYLPVNFSVNGVPLVNNPYNLNYELPLFKTDFEAAYPGSEVTLDGYTDQIIINHTSDPGDIVVTYANSNVTNTYTFADCGAPPPSLPPMAWAKVTPSKEDLDYAELIVSANGENMSANDKAVIMSVIDFTDNGVDASIKGNYTFTFDNEILQWSDENGVEVRDTKKADILTQLLPVDYLENHKSIIAKHKIEREQQMAEIKNNAVAKLESLTGKPFIPQQQLQLSQTLDAASESGSPSQYGPNFVNQTDCSYGAENLCLLFGARLKSGNSTINNTITNFSGDCGNNEALHVKKGDRIYFRVHSVENGNPVINWNPRVEYTTSGMTSVTDEVGINPYKSSYSDGFILSTPTNDIVFPGIGYAEISWPEISVISPTTDVVYEIYKKEFDGTEDEMGNDNPFDDASDEMPVYKRTCLANSTTSVSSTSGNEIVGINLANIPVTNTDTDDDTPAVTIFYFRVTAKSNTNWKTFEWKPLMKCHTTQNVVGDSGPEGTATTVTDIYPVPKYSIYKSYLCGAPYNKYSLTSIPNVNVTARPIFTGLFSSTDNGKINFVVKRAGQKKIEQTYTINNGAVSPSVVALTIGNGGSGSVEISFTSDDSALGNQVSILNKIAQAGSTTNVARLTYTSGTTTNINLKKNQVNLYHVPSQEYGPMYRQWGQFLYSPDSVEGAEMMPGFAGHFMMKEELMQFDTDMAQSIQDAVEVAEGFGDANLDNPAAFEAEFDGFVNSEEFEGLWDMAFMPLKPVRDMIDSNYDERYIGIHPESYAKDTSSRAAMMNQALDGLLEGSAETVQGVVFTGAHAITKFGVSGGKNLSAGGNADVSPGVSVGVSGSKSLDGNNRSLTDYVDMNGDRYPDIVTTENIQFTRRTGGLFPKISTQTDGDRNDNWQGYMSRTAASNWGVSASGSFAKGSSRSPGGETTQDTPDWKGAYFGKAEFQIFSGNSSAGVSGEFSKGNDDTTSMWVDMNGDGLADLVKKDGSSVSVKMSFGSDNFYTLQQTYWPGFELSKGKSTGYGGGLGFNYKSGSIELGASLGKTHSHSEYSLMDMNADGLVDLVYCESSGNGLKVKLNDGNGFGPQQQWSSFNLYDTGLSVKSSTNFALTGCLVWPLIIPPAFVIPIKFPAATGSTTFSTSTNSTTKAIVDFDGDGYPDLVERVNSGTVKVRYSRIRRTDKLKAVYNPLGGRFTVDYEVVRPTYDNPYAKWVMSDVIVEDGYDFDNDGFDAYWKEYKYEGARYDRREREFYGFETVKAIDYTRNEDNEPQAVYRTAVTKYHNRNFYLKGLAKESYIVKGSDEAQLFSKTIHTYAIRPVIPTFGSPNFGLINTGGANLPATFDTGGQEGRRSATVVLTKTENFLYELGTTPLTTQSEMTYDAYGRVLTYIDRGSALSTDDYKSVITYHATTTLTNRNIINLPSQITVYKLVPPNTQSTMMRRRSTSVNNDGKILSVTVRLNNIVENAVTNYTYNNANGNLLTVTMPPNAASQSMVYTYGYDSTNKYVTSVSDSFGYTSTMTYDPKFDKPLTVTDLAGNTTTYTYDNFGRLSTVKGPKETASGAPYTIKFEYYPKFSELPSGQTCVQNSSDFVPIAITKHYDISYPSNDIETYTLIDGLARPVQVRKDIEMNVGSVSSPTYEERMSISGIAKYDEFGRVTEQRHPWHEAKNCTYNYKFNDYDTGYFTAAEYDEVHRVIKNIDSAGNETEKTYTIANDFFSNPALRMRTVTSQNGSIDVITESYTNIVGLTTSMKNVLTTGTPDDIWTSFIYNCVGELLSYKDDQNLTTSYVYDMAGRKLSFTHPDKGTTSYMYDLASNVTHIQTPNLAANTSIPVNDRFIKYTYDYTHRIAIEFPDTPGGDNIANVTYTYGTTGNNKGQLIEQTDATGKQWFEYGNMGEVIKNTRLVVGPNIPDRYFETEFTYDSWNRLRKIIYPDGEMVNYSYNKGGNLYTIIGEMNGQPYKYIQRLDYDHYEQRTYLRYGNNTETVYQYTAELRRLDYLEAKTATGEKFMQNSYGYDKVGNVTKITNGAPTNTVNHMGGDYAFGFEYDNLNRLTVAGGRFNGHSAMGDSSQDSSADYSMVLTYNTTHGIVTKEASHTRSSVATTPNNYDSNYDYFVGTHRVKQVTDALTSQSESFDYDLNGNMVGHTTSAGTRELVWDEANRLRVVAEGDFMHHYIYDASGERILKATSDVETLYENGTIVSSTLNFDTYTTYPSGYIVIDGNGEYTKHYYSGAERIVTRIGGSAEIFEAKPAPRLNMYDQGGSQGGDKFDPEKVRQAQINDLTQMLDKKKNGTPAFKAYKPDTEQSEPEQEGTEPQSGDAPPPPPMGPPEPTLIYFYHSDHLGTAAYLTDGNGQLYQMFLNLAFGETLTEQHSLTEDYETPYKFNAKKLDSETGLYYYGARYYEPKISIWLSVDPKADKYPGFMPYTYGAQNPVTFNDPDGKDIVIYYRDENGTEHQHTYKYEKNRKFDNLGMGTNNKFLINTIKTLDHLINNGATMGIIVNGNESDEDRLLTVVNDKEKHLAVVETQGDSFYNPIDYHGNGRTHVGDGTPENRVHYGTIYFNDERGISFIGKDNKKLYNSPSALFGHEFLHMLHAEEDYEAYKARKDKKTEIKGKGNAEERQTVKEANQINLRICEPIRLDINYQADPVEMKDPTKNTPPL